MEYGLIGNPLKHSFSKEIHESLGKYNYELVPLNEQEFLTFMQEKNFKAINVTIPYKQKVIPFLDEITPEAKKINAVNTIVNKNGKLYGYNTDYLGFKSLLEQNNINVTNKNVLILGTGGTSKTTSHVLKDLKVKSITFASINHEENCITYDQIKEYYEKVEIIVNTTPVGMYPNNYKQLVDVSKFAHLESVIDVIYNPLKTSLVVSALKNNIKAVGGLFMLVAQAFYAIEIFKDIKLPKEAILKVYNDLYYQKENIVLIGMPTSGKSSVGAMLAKKLKREFIDIDEEITKDIKMDIASFINLNGEAKFREIETKKVLEVSLKNNVVIATGGGVILNNQNILALKENGCLYFLNRSLNLLFASSDRPLSASLEALEKRYIERYDKYVLATDVIINGDETISNIVNQIASKYQGR